MAPANASGADPDGDDAFTKQQRLAERAARFSNKLVGNRYKELDAARVQEREAWIARGAITAGQTDLSGAVDLRGTCEDMCTPYEREFREFTREIHPFEVRISETNERRIDHAKAVAAYTRSDAGAGHGVATILPSDLRTPTALVRSLDYLIDNIMGQQPPANPNAVNPPAPSPRRALGYSSGFIRDRTRAIRKEFALQSSWGHEEGIATFERIARWHILCLRELQEESGSNTDMHIDNAELGRCFTSLRQQYNDRREESGLDMPCANEPEFRAYMLIYDLANKSVSIPISELPQAILDHPLVQLAWQIRQAAQRNFDSQKEGSKLNAEYGLNLITRFVRLVKQAQVPYLMSCLIEVRLREMRRSAIRALTRTYPRLKAGADPVRRGDNGEIVERKMVLMPTLDRILGAEEQETEQSAWDDVEEVSRDPDDESAAIVRRFNLSVYEEVGDDSKPMGAMINIGAPYNDNKDAPFTRRWKFISDKLTTPYADIVNGRAGVGIDGAAAAQPANAAPPKPLAKPVQPVAIQPSRPAANGSAFWKTPLTTPAAALASGSSAFATSSASAFPSSSSSAFQTGRSAFGQGATHGASAFGAGTSTGTSAFGPGAGNGSAFGPGKSAFASDTKSAFGTQANGKASAPAFDFKTAKSATSAFAPEKKVEPTPVQEAIPPPTTTPAATATAMPDFFKTAAPATSTTPTVPPPPKLDFFAKKDAEPSSDTPTKAPVSFFSKPAVVDTVGKSSPEAGPSKPAIPSFFSSTPLPTTTPSSTVFSTKAPSPQPSPAETSPPPPPKPVIPSIKVSRTYMRKLPRELADSLISEVVASMMKDVESSFTAVVRQRQAAADYLREKAAKAALVRRGTSQLLSEMLDDHIRAVLFAEWFHSMRARVNANIIAREWRNWAAQRAEERERRAQQRDDDRRHLKSIGVGRSYGYLDSGSLATSRSRSARSAAPSLITLPDHARLEQEQAEASFRETQEQRRKFWEDDSSLFNVIARHVAPLIKPAGNEYSPLFEVVLLTAGQAGLPAGDDASAWLSRKLSAPSRGPEVLDGVYYKADAGFQSFATDVHDYFPGSSSTGLYILEAPLVTLNTAQRVRNMDDASDRLEAAAAAIQQGSRYRTGLLILTWENETLNEVVQRLGIERDLEAFEYVATASLNAPENLEPLFAAALRSVVPADPRKSQVVLPLHNVAERVGGHYAELLRVADNLFAEFPTSVRLVLAALRAATELLRSLPKAIEEQIEEMGESDDSSYSPPSIPPFSSPDVDADSAAEAIQSYMAHPELGAGAQLAGAELRDAVTHGRPLPVRSVLEALGAHVAQVWYATLKLEQWFDAPHHLHAARRLEMAILEDVGHAATAAISGLAEEALVERARHAPLPPSPMSDVTSSVNTGVKRQRSDEDLYDPVKAKSARLAALIAGAKAGVQASQAAMAAVSTSAAQARVRYY